MSVMEMQNLRGAGARAPGDVGTMSKTCSNELSPPNPWRVLKAMYEQMQKDSERYVKTVNGESLKRGCSLSSLAAWF